MDCVYSAEPRDFIEIRNPRRLAIDRIPCERIPLGEVDDYKPSIALLPHGELLLTMFTGRPQENGRIAEQTIVYRSSAGGRTWSDRDTPDIAGCEPALSVAADGTVFVTCHLLAQGVRNTDGYVHRSEDRGRTWTTTRIEPEEFRPRRTGLATRNVLQLADGSLLFGISEHGIINCRSFVWRSTDYGKSWSEKYPAHFEGVPEDYNLTLFGEAHLWAIAVR
jgi:hypothetical protein